ncbi:FecR family protein [Sphingopyxis sp. MWB1]|uniref:FecR family protein n=1 Tax=Sphingopyxis sp. MWB1 TaxID=1537715 RepID=UPI00068A79CA|nr:FecR domain-containing protein [Sphingopyxis sp. MWB1]
MILEEQADLSDPADMAALWCMRLSEGALSDSEWDMFEAWLAHPENASLFEQASSIWRASGEVGDWPQLIALRTEALNDYRKRGDRNGMKRRAHLLFASAAMLILAVSVSLIWYFQRPEAYETRVGERQIAVLDDGSRASLDAVTALKVRMKGDGREVELLHGRAKFDVAKDPLRPFTVAVGDKLVVAIGTSFSVELIDGEVHVILYEGEVEVRDRDDLPPAGAAPQAERHVLTPGSELTDAVGRAKPAEITRPDLAQSLSWETGLLNFDAEPLATAVERMNRYSARKIRLADTSLAAIPVDGLFQAGDIDAFAEGLSALHPLRSRAARDGIILESE